MVEGVGSGALQWEGEHANFIPLTFDSGRENMECKRQSPRRPIRVDLDLIEGDRIIPVYSKDVSRGGIFIETSKPLPVGTVVTLQYILPRRSYPVKIRGRVVHVVTAPSRSCGMGIKFLDIDEGGLSLFEELDDIQEIGREV